MEHTKTHTHAIARIKKTFLYDMQQKTGFWYTTTQLADIKWYFMCSATYTADTSGEYYIL